MFPNVNYFDQALKRNLLFQSKYREKTKQKPHTQLLGFFKHKLQEYGLQVEVLTDINHIHITDKKRARVC